MGLLLKDKLELLTPLGSQEIQLLIGDITKLPLEEKVDIIFISAFRGDYQPARSTLIGSLKHNLGISVKDLARNKWLDLWKNFSCWVSAPLPDSVPFRHLVCLENNTRIGSLVDQLSQMFLAMMPIFNNTESTVITPLLATGNQGHRGDVVLPAMVDGACHWIQAGLPLHCLKIVIFSANPSSLSETDKSYLKLFARLKAKWSLKAKKAHKISRPYDICLSFTPADKDLAEKVTTTLQCQAPDAKIHSAPFAFNHDLVWQTDIFNVMKVSRRIIILLSPAYLEDPECVEQFNIALCCNRFNKAEVVIPFHMKTVKCFPSYMSIVQYVECSLFEDEDTAAAMIESACSDVINSLKVPAAISYDTDQKGLENLALSRKTTYDIFVSYSHRHGNEPRELEHILRTNYPHLKVFFDIKDLKAGNIWQQALYEAVGKTRCFVAFMTPGYLESAVCNEEFNLALARQYAHDSILFVPVITDSLQTVSRRLTSVPYADLGSGPESIVKFAAKIAELIIEKKSRVAIPNVTIFKHMMAYKRGINFIEQFHLAGNSVVKKAPQQFLDMIEGELVFSYAQDSLKLAAILSVILKQRSPKLVCHLKSTSHIQHRRQHLDSADMVIYFVSDQFVSTQNLVEELHTGLCRQRIVKDKTIVYLIQCNHLLPRPFYFQALPFSVSVDDNLWQNLEDPVVKDNPYYHVNIPGMEGTYRCSDAQNYALTVAAHDILFLLSQRGLGSKIDYSIVNITQVENTADGIEDTQVSAQEVVVPIDSINYVMPKQHTHRRLPKGAGRLQQQISIGEITNTHQQKTLDIRDDSKLKNHSEDRRKPLPVHDRKTTVAHEPSSVSHLERYESIGRYNPKTTASRQGPQTTTRRQEKEKGSQNHKGKQKTQGRTCCIL